MIDLMIALAFGVRADEPGKSNEAIGEKVKKYTSKNDIPVIVPEEVALTLPDNFDNEVEVISGNIPWKEGGDGYKGTYDMAVKAKRISNHKKMGKSAMLICHPDQIWRASRIFENQGFELTIPQNDLKDIPYDWKSYWKQPWTKNKLLWWSKELVYSIWMDKLRRYY